VTAAFDNQDFSRGKIAKISCAAVTLPGKDSRLFAATESILAARLAAVKMDA
jgi:hypothetical protein